MGSPLLGLFVILAAVGLSAGLWLKFVRHFDRFEPEPLRSILWVGLLGGLMSTWPAGQLNSAMDGILGTGGFEAAGSSWPAPVNLAVMALFVGFNEEILKALATVILVRKRRDLDEPVDALVYSMTVALGFAAIENVDYVLEHGLGVLFIRSITAVPLHLGLAAIWGYGLARARFLPGQGHLQAMAKPVVIAALIHAAYDFIAFSMPGSLGLLSLGIAVAAGFFMLQLMKERLKTLQFQSPFAPARMCPACATEVGPDARFCPACGAQIAGEFLLVCAKCKLRIPAWASFCSGCGERIP